MPLNKKKNYSKDLFVPREDLGLMATKVLLYIPQSSKTRALSADTVLCQTQMVWIKSLLEEPSRKVFK